jgi:MoaA/NifB/PqqE/SkfB family radical SAM enzyme
MKERILELIREFAELGGKTVIITGGEPFERGTDLVVQMIELSKSFGLNVKIYSSGYPIDELVARRLSDAGLDSACISLEGTEKTHDGIAQLPGSYQKALGAIKLLSSLGVGVIVHFTAMSTNYEELEEVASLATKSGAHALKILNLIPQGRAKRNAETLVASQGESEKLAAIIERLKSSGTLDIEYGGEFSESGQMCSIGRRITVTSTGSVIPCLGLRWDKSRILGNATTTSLKDIWNGERFGEIRKLDHCLCAEAWG